MLVTKLAKLFGLRPKLCKSKTERSTQLVASNCLIRCIGKWCYESWFRGRKGSLFFCGANGRFWHVSSERCICNLAEIGAKADITEDSFLARKFCGRFFGRDRWQTGHAENMAKCAY